MATKKQNKTSSAIVQKNINSQVIINNTYNNITDVDRGRDNLKFPLKAVPSILQELNKTEERP